MADMSRTPWNPTIGAGPHPLSPMMEGANIPLNATPEMKEFLQNRAVLVQKMTELRQQNPNGTVDPKATAQFQQENAALLQRQKELSQIIGEQQAKNPPSMPPPLQIPPNASPQMKSFLTNRDQLMRDQIAFMNQHRGEDPATRQAAMQQWRQQNASRFQELKQEAQAMSQQNAVIAPVQLPVKKTGT